MSALLELAAKVEWLTGSSREVDAEIGHAMHALGWHAADCLHRFTESLDAAMTLMEARDFIVGREAGVTSAWASYQASGRQVTVTAATPALALCAAALRARSTTDNETASQDAPQPSDKEPGK